MGFNKYQNRPRIIDGARVIFCTDNHQNLNFGYCLCENKKLIYHGLAIAYYKENEEYYLFKCDEHWETITDSLCETIESAKAEAESNTQTPILWHFCQDD